MGLSRTEQETIIRYDAEEQEMEVYTAYPSLMRRLDASDEYIKIREDKQGGEVVAMTFKASKRLLTLRSKTPTRRAMTEEEKEAARQRMLELHANGKL